MIRSVLHRCKSLALPMAACLLLAPAVYAAVAAETNSKPATVEKVAKTPPRPLLWKVSDKDNSIYLLGSFHLLKPDDYPLSKDVDSAFADAEKLVFEVPPADLTNPATGVKMQQIAGFADGRKLSTVLPADLRDRLNAMLGADRVSQLDAFEPWFINLSMAIGMSQVMGFKPEQGLDLHLMQRAASAGKPTAGLETIDQQLAALDSTPMGEQIDGLKEFVANPAEVQKMLGDMHDAWRNGDDAALNSLAVEEMRKKTPESYRLINVARNDAWVPQLGRLLDEAKQDDALVVVGAMHLLGGDGVVEKLRAKGYRVERVCTACTDAR